jgi:hypothetical protein
LHKPRTIRSAQAARTKPNRWQADLTRRKARHAADQQEGVAALAAG